MSKQIENFRLMKAVEDTYAVSKMADREFAANLSASLGFPVSRARVTQARVALGIANNTEPKQDNSFYLDVCELLHMAVTTDACNDVEFRQRAQAALVKVGFIA